MIDKRECYTTPQDAAGLEQFPPSARRLRQRTDEAVDHVCGNPYCLNPKHMRLVRIRENARGAIPVPSFKTGDELTEAQFQEFFRAFCNSYPGGQGGWAADNGVTANIASQMARGKSTASRKTAKKLGFKRVARFIKIESHKP